MLLAFSQDKQANKQTNKNKRPKQNTLNFSATLFKITKFNTVNMSGVSKWLTNPKCTQTVLFGTRKNAANQL